MTTGDWKVFLDFADQNFARKRSVCPKVSDSCGRGPDRKEAPAVKSTATETDEP
jgi:hypothetical protein